MNFGALPERKFFITISNLLVICFCFGALYQDYQLKGEFQWVDPNTVEDQEELGFNIISFSFIILGILSITYQLMREKTEFYANKWFKVFMLILKIFSFLYAVTLILLGIFLTIIILFLFKDLSVNDIIGAISMAIAFPTFIFLGFQIILQAVDDANEAN